MPAQDTSVKYFDSTMAGAPALSNVAGNFISVLSACLVDGFGLVTLTSLVVSGGVATATLPSTPAAKPGCVVLIAGATGDLAAINGEHKVQTVGTNTVLFDAFGIADGTVTGTVTLMMAPAGWQKAFSGTNLAAYKSPNPGSTGAYFRINDTGTTNARIVGFETMSDVNTGSGQFPTEAQLAGGGWIPKSNSGARSWYVIANNRTVYIGVAPWSTDSIRFGVFGFGDYSSTKANDAYGAFIFAANGGRETTSLNNVHQPLCGNDSSSFVARFSPRSYSSIGIPVALSTFTLYSNLSGMGGLTFPNPENNGIIFAPIHVTEGGTVRGRLAGIFSTPQTTGATALTDGSLLNETDSIAKFMLYRICGMSGTTAPYHGGFFYDLSGPWEC
jgi:hypothetical protein